MKQFRGFLHYRLFPYFLLEIFVRFSFLQHIDFTENICRILIKQTGHFLHLYIHYLLQRIFYNIVLNLSCNGLLLSTVKNLFPHNDKSRFTVY
jgi:hypothetical protein